MVIKSMDSKIYDMQFVCSVGNDTIRSLNKIGTTLISDDLLMLMRE